MKQGRGSGARLCAAHQPQSVAKLCASGEFPPASPAKLLRLVFDTAALRGQCETGDTGRGRFRGSTGLGALGIYVWVMSNSQRIPVDELSVRAIDSEGVSTEEVIHQIFAL
jgi:hypothetical protein